MAIRATKYMDEVDGLKEHAGTSLAADGILIDSATLNAAGTNVKMVNHGHTWAAGDALHIYDQETGGGATLGVYEITAGDSDNLTITPAAGNSVATLVDVAVGGPWPPGYPAHATGTGNMSQSFGLNEPWTLIRVNCHFSGGSGRADLAFNLDSTLGAVYDVALFRLRTRGTGFDANFRCGTLETGAPSVWGFETGDLLTFAWINPDPAVMTWGLTVRMMPSRLLESWRG